MQIGKHVERSEWKVTLTFYSGEEGEFDQYHTRIIEILWGIWELFRRDGMQTSGLTTATYIFDRPRSFTYVFPAGQINNYAELDKYLRNEFGFSLSSE